MHQGQCAVAAQAFEQAETIDSINGTPRLTTSIRANMLKTPVGRAVLRSLGMPDKDDPQGVVAQVVAANDDAEKL